MSVRTTWVSILSNLLVMSTCGSALGSVIRWDNPAGGDFGVESNWNPSQIPGPADDAVFSLDAAFSVGFDQSYATHSLEVRGGDVTLDLGGLTLDTSATGTLVGDQRISPTLRVTNGRLTGQFGRVASEADAAGGVELTGSGSWISQFLQIGGSNSRGSILISDGAQLDAVTTLLSWNPGSTGAVTVTGPGSRWTNRGTLYFGFSNDGNARLAIENGGQVVNTGTPGGWVHIGILPGTEGAATVTGSGSRWTIASTLQVGGHTDEDGNGVSPGGHGTLLIADGAEVTCGNGIIAASRDSTGEVTVTGAGSTWTMDYLGVAGGWVSSGSGRLLIADGGRVNSGRAEIATVAGSQTGTGQVTVTGAGSTWNVAGTFPTSGFLNVGSPRGQGSVIIGPGALVEVGRIYNQRPNATLRYELAGAVPGSGFGLLEVAGYATLDGTLDVALVSGFVPQASDEFTILTTSSRTGYFQNALPEGNVGTLVTEQGTFSVTYNRDSVVLSNFTPR